VITLNNKYKPLWTTSAFITIVTGGRGSGKSFAVGDFIENLSFQKGHKVLFTRYALYTTSDSIIPEFEEKIDLEGHNDHFYITKSDVINKRSGVEILFRGIKTSSGNQTAKLKSIQGLTDWILEEAEELDDEAVFNTIMQSVRQKGIQNRIILVLNPKSKTHWIYKRFFEDPGVDPKFNGEKDGVCYIHTSYLENLDNLSEEFIAEAERCKKYTPEIYRYDYMGEWVLSIEGAFLPMDKLQRYKKLNDEGTNLLMIDTADEGTDHFAGLIGRLVGNKFYVRDAIFNLVNLNLNEPVVKDRIEKHKIDKYYVETNSFGKYFYRNIKDQNPGVASFGFFSKANKLGRILAQSGWILEFVYWPEHPNDELYEFMKQMCSVTSESKDEDDAADCTAAIAYMIRRDYIRS
jgi:PBSX family phage terminase large subunit